MMEFNNAPGIPIIEDARVVGANTNVYRLGVAGSFSFHPRKTITTGEGG